MLLCGLLLLLFESDFLFERLFERLDGETLVACPPPNGYY